MRIRSTLLAITTCVLLTFACATAATQDAPTYGYVFTPPESSVPSPRIRKVELNDSDLHAGGTIAIRVTTTRDVVQVITGSGKHEGSLLRTSPGVFVGQSTLPHLGGFLRVRIKLHFRALTSDGREDEIEVPVTYK